MPTLLFILGFLVLVAVCGLLSWGAWAWLGWWGLVPVGLISLTAIGYAGFLLIGILCLIDLGSRG